MKHTILFIAILSVISSCNPVNQAKRYDLVIYGAKNAGIAAGIQAFRMGVDR
jgi:hypothetical protein